MMETYNVKHKQNIFDVAVTLYGSIEGMLDLFASNPSLSFDDTLESGTVLNWNPDIIMYPNIINTFRDENYYPANGENHVYVKEDEGLPLCAYIKVIEKADHLTITMSGTGDIIMDWGDNSELETIHLTSNIQTYNHPFDSVVINRYAKVYSNADIDTWDLSKLQGKLLLIKPVSANKVITGGNNPETNNLFLIK